ncbi:MAG: hypothetical protein ACOCYX_04645 [Spirochaetota bacterium]
MIRMIRVAALCMLPLLALSGCLLQFSTPRIELFAEPAYNDPEILIPYELWGDGPDAHARWTLEVYTGSAWELLESREVRVPSGSAGVLSLGHLGEAQYRLTFEMLTVRNGTYEAASYLTIVRRFYVDKTAPTVGDIVVAEGGGAASSDETQEAWITLENTSPPNADYESPEYFIAVVDDVRPPTLDERVEHDPGRMAPTVWLWPASPPGTTYSFPVSIALVDEAGNRSDVTTRYYGAP